MWATACEPLAHVAKHFSLFGDHTCLARIPCLYTVQWFKSAGYLEKRRQERRGLRHNDIDRGRYRFSRLLDLKKYLHTYAARFPFWKSDPID